MALELRRVQVGLPDDVYQSLRVVANVNDQDLGEAARALLTESLLGKSHTIRLAAQRLARAAMSGNEG